MRIAFVLPSLDNKGPNIVAKYIIDRLVEKHQVDVFYFDNTVGLDFPCPTFRIHFFQKIPFENYQIVHSHMLRPDLYVAFWSLFGKVGSSKFSTVHQETFKALSLEFNTVVAFVSTFIWNMSFLFFDNVIVLNKFIKKQIWFLPLSKISIVCNGIPFISKNPVVSDFDLKLLNDFKSRFEFVLGSCSLLINRKGLDQIIRSLEFLPNVGYIIIGDGPEKEKLSNLAKEKGVLNQCLFLGSRSDGFRYFCFFDVYMLPSLSEGHPISGLEAYRIGLPVVCSNIDVLIETFSSNEVVFFDLGDIKSLLRGIHEARSNIDFYSKNLRERFYSSFTDTVMVENYLKVYNKYV